MLKGQTFILCFYKGPPIRVVRTTFHFIVLKEPALQICLIKKVNKSSIQKDQSSGLGANIQHVHLADHLQAIAVTVSGKQGF